MQIRVQMVVPLKLRNFDSLYFSAIFLLFFLIFCIFSLSSPSCSFPSDGKGVIVILNLNLINP